MKKIILFLEILVLLLITNQVFSQGFNCIETVTCSTDIDTVIKIIEIKKKINNVDVFCKVKVDFKIKKCSTTTYIQLDKISFHENCDPIGFFNLNYNIDFVNLISLIEDQIILYNLFNISSPMTTIKFSVSNIWENLSISNISHFEGSDYIEYFSSDNNYGCCLTTYSAIEYECNKLINFNKSTNYNEYSDWAEENNFFYSINFPYYFYCIDLDPQH